MTFPTTDEAEQAILARTAGIWDDPALIKCGLLNHLDEDVRRIKTLCLKAYGYKVGGRDSRINTNYPGAFMVAEPHEESELPTEDGRDGPWCVVGDDLDDLIDRGYEALVSMVDPLDGTSGQDRESYSDDQDGDSYNV